MTEELTDQQRYDRERYQNQREKLLDQRREYYFNYEKKGLKKPRKQRQPRSIRDHERYLEKREEILAKQKIYRDTHKDEIRERRRKRDFEKVYGKQYN